MNWLRNLKMDDLKREILNEYLAKYDVPVDKIERFTSRIEELSHMKRYEENISKLRCFKGINTLSAMTIQVETSDFNRFPNAKAYADKAGKRLKKKYDDLMKRNVPHNKVIVTVARELGCFVVVSNKL